MASAGAPPGAGSTAHPRCRTASPDARGPSVTWRGPPDPVGEVVRGFDAGQRAPDPPGPGPHGRRRDDLRGASQRHGRRRGLWPQERERRILRGGPRRSSPTVPRRVLREAARRTGHPGRRGRSSSTGRPTSAVRRERPEAWSTAHPVRGSGPHPAVVPGTVPVIETGVGICHVYVDAAADLAKALADRPRRRPPRRACATPRRPSSSIAPSPLAFVPKAAA